MYISSTAQPAKQPDAVRALVKCILNGGDVTLVDEGDEGGMLLDLAANRLAGLRTRILRAAEVLPGTLGVPMPSPQSAGPCKVGVPNDELLIQGFQALTVLDQTCDRIVLLVSDAHALQYSALRYIQFVSRSGGHLQLVFVGTHKLFDLLNKTEFSWLRARLMAGLVVTLRGLIADSSDLLGGSPSVPSGPALGDAKAAVPPHGARKRSGSASMPSRILWVGALAMLGLSGAAGLRLGMRSGEVNGPPTIPEPSAVSAPETQVLAGPASHSDAEASRAATDAPAPHRPVMASDVQGAGPGSPSSMSVAPPSTTASGALMTAGPRGDVDGTATSEQAAAVVQPPAIPEASAVSAPGTQVPASHADSEASRAATDAPAPHRSVMASDVQGAGPGSPSSTSVTPPSTTASGALIAAGTQTKAGAAESEPNEPRLPEPLPRPAQSLGRHGIPAAPSRTAASTPGSRVRRLKEAKDQSAPLPTGAHWLAPQPALDSWEPPGGGSPRYIGSYTTDANGVRMFHLEP